MGEATLLAKQRWNSQEGRVHVEGADSDVCMVMPPESHHRQAESQGVGARRLPLAGKFRPLQDH